MDGILLDGTAAMKCDCSLLAFFASREHSRATLHTPTPAAARASLAQSSTLSRGRPCTHRQDSESNVGKRRLLTHMIREEQLLPPNVMHAH